MKRSRSQSLLSIGRELGLLFAVLMVVSSDRFSFAEELLKWTQLPPLSNAEGFAGCFAGVSKGSLLVAGGANFPDKPPWKGGTKVWYNDVYAIEKPNGEWRPAGTLPGPRAYGVSITTPDGLLCIGGSDESRHYADCFLLSLKPGLLTTAFPNLPMACANLSGALLGNTVYVAGGSESPSSTQTLKKMWSLDLANLERGWREEPPWPGPPRMLAVAAVQDGSFFLVSGTDLSAGPDGKPVRTYLKDGYRYRPGVGWNRIADLPRPAVAAPSPAPSLGQSHFLVLGGDDGKHVDFEPKDQHPGFPREILAYHTITDTWIRVGESPFPVVTAPTTSWGEHGNVIPSGEIRPGKRSPEVWRFRAIETPRESFGWINYAVIGIYLGGMLGIGAWFASRQKSTADYFKAGGRIPWWAAGISIYATMLSSITFLSIPAKAYATDWKYFWQNVPILLLAPLVIYVYLPFFRQLDVTTAYEYLERRFHPIVRLYGSTAFILFQIGRQAIVLYLPSLALATITDMDIQTSIVILGVLCVAYTAMGGIEAVIWTDVIQTFVLLGAALLCLGIIIADCTGGLSGFLQTANEFGKFDMFEWKLDWKTTTNAFWVILGGNLFITLVPYTSDQTVVQRYMTTRDERKAAQAIWTNALLSIPSTLFFFAIGTALWVYYHEHPDRLQPTIDTDGIFPSFIVHALPVGVAGVVIAGVFAAAQSTVSSSLNSVATAVVTDFYRRFHPNASDRFSLHLARVTTLLTGLSTTAAALFLASSDVRSLWDAYNTLVGLAGSGLAGLFLLGIMTKRANAAGAITGAFASAVVLYWVQTSTRIHFLLYAAIGILTCFAVGYAVSLLVPTAPKNLTGLTIFTRTNPSD